jgi:hypothetical protein
MEDGVAHVVVDGSFGRCRAGKEVVTVYVDVWPSAACTLKLSHGRGKNRETEFAF